MAFDGIITNAMVCEINKNILGCRLEKIQMPTKSDIVLTFHTGKEKLKLLICIEASNARIHFTKTQKENPVKAPQFCMVLRKYLQGAKVVEVNQLGLDRVVLIGFENINELGNVAKYTLCVELMGKYSNIILVNESNKILDSIKHVDASMSSVREVLPAREYVLPTTLHKQEFKGMTYENFIANIQLASMDPYFSEDNMVKIIANQFVGFSKLFFQNVMNYIGVTTSFDKTNTVDMFNLINLILYNANTHMLHLMMYDNDYHIDLGNFSTTINTTELSDFLDKYYSERDSLNALKTATFNLQKDVNTFKSKYVKNLKRVLEILDEQKDMEKYKLYGELISANIYRISPGQKEIELENYYDNNALIKISLNEHYSASRNAQNYFKKYTKLKNAIAYAEKQKQDYEDNIDYLDSVLYLIDSATSIEELNNIKEELHEAGYINYAVGKKKYKDDEALGPYKYEYDGVEILAGRNNIQNDKLTLKLADKSFTWLHVKDHHGSHVIVKSDNPSDKVLEFAASIAVKHSEAKNSSKVSVDYTKVKFVHKPSGSKPGKVIYTNYKTIII